MKSLKSAFLSPHACDDFGEQRDPFAVARMQHAVALRVEGARLDAADIEPAELGPGEIANRPPLASAEPASVAVAAELGLEKEVVEDDELAVAGELNVELGPVEARGTRTARRRKECFPARAWRRPDGRC